MKVSLEGSSANQAASNSFSLCSYSANLVALVSCPSYSIFNLSLNSFIPLGGVMFLGVAAHVHSWLKVSINFNESENLIYSST